MLPQPKMRTDLSEIIMVISLSFQRAAGAPLPVVAEA
jgi:hypothetical protein